MRTTRKSNHSDDQPDLNANSRQGRRFRPADTVAPGEVIAELEKHILVDGFKLVIDLEKSCGSRLVDAGPGGSSWICTASLLRCLSAINIPISAVPKWRRTCWRQPRSKWRTRTSIRRPTPPSSRRSRGSWGCRRWTVIFSSRVAPLAVENALKAAMDWKVRKNLAAGRGERGTEILHFEQRLSRAQRLHDEPDQHRPAQDRSTFAKFPWPRDAAPCIDFSLPAAERAAGRHRKGGAS